jgi:hypothetical protein
MSFRGTITAWERRKHHRCTDAAMRAALRCEPSKDELRAMLEGAARNTANLSVPTDETCRGANAPTGK